MITFQDFSLLLNDVLDEIRQQLNNRRSGVDGVGTVVELEKIQKELLDLAVHLKEHVLSPQNQRYLRAAYIVMQTWPPKETLGERICMIDYLYRHDLEE